jgi:hypothetical protein
LGERVARSFAWMMGHLIVVLVAHDLSVLVGRAPCKSNGARTERYVSSGDTRVGSGNCEERGSAIAAARSGFDERFNCNPSPVAGNPAVTTTLPKYSFDA